MILARTNAAHFFFITVVSCLLPTQLLMCQEFYTHSISQDMPDQHQTSNRQLPDASAPTDDHDHDTEDADTDDDSLNQDLSKYIAHIYILGNRYVPTQALLARIPYKEGELFDVTKTRRLINNLFFDLKRLRSISVYARPVGGNRVDLYIVVEEKKPLKQVILEGNSQVTEKEIREKVPFAELPAADEEELKRYALAIKKVYKEKGYYLVDITTRLTVDTDDKAIATFTITEHPKPIVKRILFKGNHALTDKQLKDVLFTKEDWIMSFMDKSGTFQEERVEADQHIIEQTYQNHGYINAKVADTQTIIDPVSHNVTVIHEIQEGDKYIVSDVSAAGNNILSEEYLCTVLPIKAGDVYSREAIVEAIRSLEFIWGDFGYVYASIEPSIIPNEDTKTVSITFLAEIGKPVYLNKLTIKGNKKSRDKIIRRKISLEEGGLLTNRQLESSKNRLEGLGYFDQRTGITWKMTRLADDLADVDLIVKEIKTGSAHVQLGFGGSGSLARPSDGVTLEGSIADSNLFGTGMRVNLTGRLGADEKTVVFNLTQPWMFDRPIFGSMDIYHKRFAYDDLFLTLPVNEKHTGGTLTAGFVTGMHHRMFNDTFIRFSIGLDDIKYECRDKQDNCSPKAIIRSLPTMEETIEANTEYNRILRKEFEPGSFVTFTTQMGRDTRNHPMHPTRGYSWVGKSVFAGSALCGNLGFYKFDVDLNWFTPLIGDYELVLRVHNYFGVVIPFPNRTIPYRELFHIGGPGSVRGFLYGQIGPQFSVVNSSGNRINDSIGGQKAFFVNVELLFPIMPDFSIKGVLFYDGGAGWDNPFVRQGQRFITNNNFHYRHAVGFGIRLMNPMPIKIDWGFKLDAIRGEPLSEVHFGMSYDW